VQTQDTPAQHGLQAEPSRLEPLERYARLHSVLDDQDVRQALERAGLHPANVEQLGLARAELGCLCLPAFDPWGILRGHVAAAFERFRERDDPITDGLTVGPLVTCNLIARRMLFEGEMPTAVAIAPVSRTYLRAALEADGETAVIGLLGAGAPLGQVLWPNVPIVVIGDQHLTEWVRSRLPIGIDVRRIVGAA
jgi:hypothetical protein